ncbi:hypothetical protein Y032_0050g2061 [Ancylostoma ceylanicum]|uniref:Metalloendopeptidase n=1 Tax=Ancylostoma ceylanicum TaxID=53326 RepID=A0A016U8S4_9BILA|nr:hypothetical protein Y032_0050g2061 [Ancylostoma ceylanicum]
MVYLMNFQDDYSKELFTKAASAWEKDTCVKFKFDKEALDNMLVRDDVGKSCLFKRSRTGRGNQTMYVGCRFFGGVAHELGHAIWLDHTHKRHDRDDYLKVDWENVKQEFNFVSRNFTDIKIQRYREQYEKLTELQNENYDVPYDYGSIMHY